MRSTPLTLVILLLAGTAVAGWRDIPAADFTMAPPPALGTPASDADYAELLKLQASRTPQDCSEAADELIPDFKSLFGTSGILTAAESAAAGPLIDAASKAMSAITGAFKKKFARPRPYDADPRVKPCIDKPGGATAYPSTHAAAGVFDGCVLGLLFPGRANVLASHGLRAGELRLLAGVHHPTDGAAGRLIGAQYCARLQKESDFLAELAAVKASLP